VEERIRISTRLVAKAKESDYIRHDDRRSFDVYSMETWVHEEGWADAVPVFGPSYHHGIGPDD
jgi:hypothetical protein